MKLVLAIWIFISSVVKPCHLFCQPDVMESLKYVVQHANDDTLKVNTLNIIARRQWSSNNYQLSEENGQQALSLATSISFIKGIRDSHDNLGEANYYSGKEDEALDHFRTTIRLSGLLKDRHGVAYGYRQIAWLYQTIQKNALALSYFDTSLMINQEIKDTISICEVLSRQAMIHTSMKNYEKANRCHELANSLYQDMGSLPPGTVSMNNAFVSNLIVEQGLSMILAQQEKQKKMFAYALSALLLLMAALSVFWYRRNKRLQHQRSITNERLRISHDLHDEIGATLSGIVMYSHLAKGQAHEGNKEAEKSIGTVQEIASEMVNKLNDVVWLVNPMQDNLEKLIEKLEEYAIQSTSSKNMDLKVNVPEHLHNIVLPIDTRKGIYLFCKEAINNAVKYSQGTAIEFNVTQTDHNLEFIIKDNGIGFEHQSVKRGNGLNNMEQRAEEIGGEYQLVTKIGSGTVISLKCKIT